MRRDARAALTIGYAAGDGGVTQETHGRLFFDLPELSLCVDCIQDQDLVPNSAQGLKSPAHPLFYSVVTVGR